MLCKHTPLQFALLWKRVAVILWRIRTVFRHGRCFLGSIGLPVWLTRVIQESICLHGVNRCFNIEITLVRVLWTYRLLPASRNLQHVNLCAYICLLLVCRFSLQTRRGGLVKIYDSALMSGVYKFLPFYKQTDI